MRHLLVLFMFAIPAFLGLACAIFDQKPVCPPSNPNCVNLPDIPSQNGYEGISRDAGMVPEVDAR